MRSTSPGWCCSARGIALLSYVLEVFGEHRLSVVAILGLLAISAAAAGGLRRPRHARRASRCSISACSGCAPSARRSSGSFFSRLGLGGIPFLFPLLYQIGLGFSPIQSGLLVMPQAIAAIGLKLIVPRILARLRLSHRAGRQHADPRRC